MDIKPNHFVPTTTPAQPAGQASDVRRAFEAMLTASSARTTIPPVPMAAQDRPLTASNRAITRPQIGEPAPEQTAPSRPGRVLDIKV